MQKNLPVRRLSRWLAGVVLALLATLNAQAQLTGPKTIPGTYASLAAAITDLNTQGVGAGGVTFNIAAGYTETAANLLITATGTAANPIVFQKAGTGANPLITAGVGTTTTLDAVIGLAGSDYVTIDGIDVAENAANTTATTQMEFGYALFRASATDGSQFNTIRNCVVTLLKTNANTIGIYGATSTAASTTAVTATATTGANSSNKVYSNVVTNSLTGIYFAAGSATTVANYDQNNEIGVTAGNIIGNFGGSASAYAAGGTYQNGLKITGNTINSTLNYTSATASTPVAASTVTSTLRGIYTPNGTSSNVDITNNTITLASGATTSQMSGIENGMGSTAASNTVNITGNTVTNCSYATATSATIYSIYSTASAATINITGNTITTNTLGGTASTSMSFYGVYNTGAGTTANLGNNTVTNNTIAGSGTVSLMYGGSPTNLNITTNTITGNSKTGGVTTTGSFYCIQALTTIATVTGNTVNNNTINAAGSVAASLYGYYDLSSPTAETVMGNTFTNLTISGTSTATGHVVAGIYSNPIAGTIKNYSQNTIGNIGSTLSSTVYGIYTVTGATVAISRNKIYTLTAGDVAGLVYGVYISSGVTVTASNNIIGDLQAPASTSLLGATGIYIGAATTANAYYNTVYLAATSTGATFGTSGIYMASLTPTVDLRNNLVINKSTAAGTGGYTAALRRLSGTAGTAPSTLASTTNNNLYYAGTPSATNLIYVEGTTTATNASQTLAAYKALVATRENNSVTEDTPFLSTTGTAATFLHVSASTPTQVESAGTPVSGITVDFDGDTRNTSTPDIGADEGTFQPLDLTPPSIVYTALANTGSTGNRTVVATITDASGLSTTAVPRIFYRKGTTGTFTSAVATSSTGNSYTFTINAATLGGLAAGDVVQYYVVAQDVPGNVGSNPAGGTFTTAPATPSSYTILPTLNGIYYVGSGTSPDPTRTFATVTAAANAYNNSGLGGAVTFLLLDASYSTAETFPIVFGNNSDASATNTLTIRPNAGVTSTITSAASGLAFLNARYVTLDGSNVAGGTTRNLTVSTTSTTANSYVVGLLSIATTGPGNQFVTVRSTNIVGGSNTATTFGLYVGNGPDNDNITLTNNSVQGTYYGIYALGSAVTSAGGMDNFVLSNNVVGPAVASTTANIGTWGILVSNAVAASITGNEVQNVSGANTNNVYGLYLVDTKNAVVSRNSIHNISYTGTSTYKVWALNSQNTNLATAANPSAVRLDNNLVYNITSTTTSTTWNTVGINLSGGYGDQIVYNSVYLSGALSAASGTSGSAAFANGNPSVTNTSTNIDVRNNIFSIVGASGGNATTPLYAHYEQGTTVTGSTLNYNDLYVTVGATGLAQIGHLGTTDYATLATWQTATSQEANSVSVDPQFAQTTAVPYNLTPSNVALNNVATPISGVTTDYTGATRGTTPDIGAIEFTPVANDLAAAGLVAPAATSSCYGTAEAVSVSIRNAGTAPLNFATTAATITVVVTLPGGGTQTLTTTLNTGTLASNATQTVVLPTTLNMSTIGTYSFAITATVAGDGNTANDLLAPAPTRTVSAPVAGTLAPAATTICVSGTATLTLTGAANGTIQYQSSTNGTTFTDIAGATSATYTTPVLTATTYYRAQVRCNTGTATSNVSTITVNNPLVATAVTPVTICSGSTATLTATASAGSSVRFFSAATGGTALATAGTYTTPALTASTTYYVEAFAGGTENVGAAAYNSTGQTQQTGGALYFTTTAPTTIANVTVYLNAGQAAGTVTIDLRTGSSTTGAVVNSQSVAFAVPAGPTTGVAPYTIPLNYTVPAAGQYTLYLASATQGGLLRDSGGSNSTGYPYTSPSGTVSITGTSVATYYYYFYNWQIGSECVGATRTPIQVNVTQPSTASFPAATASTCGSTPYQLAGTVGGSATTGTYTTSGTGTFSPNATTLTATYTPSAADITAGSVTITLTSTAAPCAPATATLALSIGRQAVATFSYPTTGGNCAGSTGTVTPTLATGSTAGTFTSTTGLTINATTGVVNLATSTAGTYTVTNTVAASGSCAAATATATITVNPTPARPTITPTYNGTVTTLTSSSATGNQFYFNGVAITGATGQTYVVNGSASTYGSYTVVVTNSFGCSSQASVVQVVTTTKGSIAGASLLVYPNPTPTGQVTLELSGFRSTTQLAVIDALGRVVRAETLPAMAGTVTHALDLSGMASGVYMLRLTNADGIETRRLVRE